MNNCNIPDQTGPGASDSPQPPQKDTSEHTTLSNEKPTGLTWKSYLLAAITFIPITFVLFLLSWLMK